MLITTIGSLLRTNWEGNWKWRASSLHRQAYNWKVLCTSDPEREEHTVRWSEASWGIGPWPVSSNKLLLPLSPAGSLSCWWLLGPSPGCCWGDRRSGWVCVSVVQKGTCSCVLSLSWKLVFAVRLLIGFAHVLFLVLFSSRSFPSRFGHYAYFICVCDVCWNKCFPFQ